MPQVNVEVNGRTYALTCGPGEEEQVILLARRLDAHTKGMKRGTTANSEAHNLIMASILLAEELTAAEEKAAALEEQNRALSQSGAGGAPDERIAEMEQAIAAMLDKATAEIEAVVDDLADAV